MGGWVGGVACYESIGLDVSSECDVSKGRVDRREEICDERMSCESDVL